MPLQFPLIWSCSNPDGRKHQYMYVAKMSGDE
jgi:hypothetical protein